MITKELLGVVQDYMDEAVAEYAEVVIGNITIEDFLARFEIKEKELKNGDKVVGTIEAYPDGFTEVPRIDISFDGWNFSLKLMRSKNSQVILQKPDVFHWQLETEQWVGDACEMEDALKELVDIHNGYIIIDKEEVK